MMGPFEAYEPAALRIPIRGEFGQLMAATAGALRDEEVELLRASLLARLPSRCADDGLDVIGRMYGIERYPGQTHASYRAALEAAWPTRKLQGSAEAVEMQIAMAFGCDVRVQYDEEGAFWPPGEWYSRFRVRIGTGLGTLTLTNFIIGEGVIGQTPIGGPHVDAAQRRVLKRIILRWAAAHGYAVDILVWISGGPPIGEGVIGSMVIGGESEQIWIGRLVGKNIVIGSTPIGGYDRT